MRRRRVRSARGRGSPRRWSLNREGGHTHQRERGQGRQVERSGPGRCATRAGGPARKAAPEPPAATAGGPGLHPDRACEQREMREGGGEEGEKEGARRTEDG
ncbi:unnamed protein product [Prorocentrum cordatum]|uniref:Uncharacterized protein n=1 Tax=Prorocentrum cordatum TaxID=2364126 RepID=A0ABN9R3K0_9DINO|nr:unnamed protein product [Polarella glacialis]